MVAELCRDVAFEAARRSVRVNPHELWAALDVVDELGARLVVDVWSEPAVWWAWWSIGVHVIGVSPQAVHRGFSGDRLPSSVVEVVGDPRERSTRMRVVDQVAGRPVDVLVLGGPNSEDGVRHNFHTYAPVVRPGGLVLVHGIANEQYPGIGRFWSAVDTPGRRELVGSADPDGYGVVEIHGKESADHG